MERRYVCTVLVLAMISMSGVPVAGFLWAWDPVAVKDDPLLRMPGTQPDQGVESADSQTCVSCHADVGEDPGPIFNWQGSMMAHAARDFLFWASLTAAAQDSIWATGTPNTADLCFRCHMPGGVAMGAFGPYKRLLHHGHGL
jgi:cytochrome c553